MAEQKAEKIKKAAYHGILKSSLIRRGLIPENLYNLNPKLEPDWYSGDLNGYPNGTCYPPRAGIKNTQQNELLYPVFNDIVNGSLHKVYEKYTATRTTSTTGREKTFKPKTVVIVGAGAAGLSAAYELLRAGHKVKIVETQDRAGGRIKTFTEKDGFAKELYADAGAMRLPNAYNVVAEAKFHYLTSHYISEFGLGPSLKLFRNSAENTWFKFYNMKPMKKSDWKKDSYKHTSEQWPGWDQKFHCDKTVKTAYKADKIIKDINDLYTNTFDTIKVQLTDRLAHVSTNTNAAAIWAEWVDNWSRFSLVGLMRSNLTIIKATLNSEYWTKITGGEDQYDGGKLLDQTKLTDLLPWPEEAIKAFSVFNYTEQLDQCLVQYLRDELGQWWSDEMHHIDGGMHRLTEKFLNNSIQPLEGLITYNYTVNEIEYAEDSVKVKGFNSKSGRLMSDITGNAVIVTVPLHAVRQINFTPAPTNETLFPNKFYQAVEDIWYGPSTKIMIQSRTKFWANTGNKEKDILGGFTITSLPIGQFHYPTIEEDADKESPGILLCYMWKAEALLFGALEPQLAIRKAVSEIAQIHPKIEYEFEAGAIHAWYNDPAAQGAYALLKPQQFQSVHYLMMNPVQNVFFAGEGISHCTGWIQGALESGLRAAYQFYSRNEADDSRSLLLRL